MKLITLYKQLLEVGSMSADKEGFISGRVKPTDKNSPVTIKGKRLVLPTKHQLTTSDWSDRIVFHPLYENVLRGESQVIEKLRSLIAMRLNYTVGVIGTALLQLAASSGEHAKLNPDQSSFLAKVRMLDEKSVQTFIKLLDALDPTDGKHNFVYLYLKRSGSIAGKKHARVGIVSFPIFQELNSESVCGVKLRNKDREVFKNLLEYIFPTIVEDGSYNAGSDSPVAPYTDAMMRTFLKLIAPVNDVIDLFKDVYPELEEMRFNCEWVEELDKLDSYHPDIRSIPMQAGNEGSSLIKGVGPAADTPIHQEAPPPPPPPQQPMHNIAPVQPAIPPVGYQFPQNQFTPNPIPPANMGWAQPPQQPMGYPNMQQQPMGVVKTKDGADFGSILASNPTLAASTYAFSHPQQMMRPVQDIPRWAQPPQQQGYHMQGMSPGMGGGYPPMGGMGHVI